MKSYITNRQVQWIRPVSMLLIILFSFCKSFATLTITVNGQSSGSSFSQGSSFQWYINGLANGAIAKNQLWIDLNKNGAIDPGSDLLFVGFQQTDGTPGGDSGPGDDDATANGSISTTVGDLSFPEGNYIFKISSGGETAYASFVITAMAAPTYHVNGSVTKNGAGMQNIVVRVEASPKEYYALTDNNGNYSIPTDLPSGTSVDANVPTGSFNAILQGYVVTPDKVSLIITSDISGINYIVYPGKIITGTVTDTLGNPIPDLMVSAYPSTGGNGGYGTKTNTAGKYTLTTDTGLYIIQFGSDQEPKGYIKTYYNQKYINWMSDPVSVTSATDTIKNINAILKKGGLITGTFLRNGVPVRGSVSVFNYNTPGNPLYECWHDSTESYYYLFVPPGIYTVQFNQESSSSGVYYNQSLNWPGVPVTVLSFSDTAKNINVDFGAIPHKFVFTGNGNWSNAANWKNNQLPPNPLAAGDSIIINHANGGNCILDIPQMVSNGGFMVILTGKNLVITGELKLQ